MARNCRTESLDKNARHLLRSASGAGREYHERVGSKAELCYYFVLLRLYELGDASDDLAVLVHSEPVALGAGLDLGVVHGLVDELAALVEVGDDDGLDLAVCKRCELFRAEELCHVCYRQVYSEVRLVRAVLLHCLEVRDAYERRARCSVVFAVLGENGRKYILDDLEDVVLARESHLHIKLVELTRAPVASGVLVPEAGCDLEISVDTGHHQKLLELLGCLGKCIELAGVLTRRNEVVSRALR